MSDLKLEEQLGKEAAKRAQALWLLAGIYIGELLEIANSLV